MRLNPSYESYVQHLHWLWREKGEKYTQQMPLAATTKKIDRHTGPQRKSFLLTLANNTYPEKTSQ